MSGVVNNASDDDLKQILHLPDDLPDLTAVGARKLRALSRGLPFWSAPLPPQKSGLLTDVPCLMSGVVKNASDDDLTTILHLPDDLPDLTAGGTRKWRA